MYQKTLIAVAPAALLLAVPLGASAQCDPVDFEEFAVGTIATNIIPGVEFSAAPGSCGGPGSVLPIVVDPFGGTSSGDRAVSLETGCPDFSPDRLVMIFDDNQTDVEFTVGAQFGSDGLSFTVTWFASPSGVGEIGSETFTSASGVNRLVRINAPLGNLRRIDVHEALGFFETVDDLVFGQDTTPPTVEITAPPFDSCVCGDEFVSIVGTVIDDDGTYECDELSYRPVNADADEPWIPAGGFCGPVEKGTLYAWNSAGVPAGRYYLRVVGSNACGLENSDITVVRIDRSFGSIGISGFDGGREDGTLCGVVEVLGGISDGCGVSTWSLDIAPAGGGFSNVEQGIGGRSCVIVEEFETTGYADGDYTLRVTATDNCGHTAFHEVGITIDNSRFCLCGPDTNGDGVVNFADILLILANWS